MRRMKQRFGLLLAVVATFGLMLMVSHQPVQAEKVTYSVTPVYPDNQTDTELGYYDLKLLLVKNKKLVCGFKIGEQNQLRSM